MIFQTQVTTCNTYYLPYYKTEKFYPSLVQATYTAGYSYKGRDTRPGSALLLSTRSKTSIL